MIDIDSMADRLVLMPWWKSRTNAQGNLAIVIISLEKDGTAHSTRVLESYTEDQLSQQQYHAAMLATLATIT